MPDGDRSDASPAVDTGAHAEASSSSSGTDLDDEIPF
jgi:hypothetical protein